ncbi:UreF-domain-containing protein [Fomitopsis serialis]|uniref:UreF-domain-containing protein n=1 Tax=Fomitopsis serialis TaxID=139415 RepID=UPI002007C5B5|nr:UreF-domain-containing protein [Neoantrodia serialis]KAH9938003.1 UreF-domain-containing protein [Neoantrodia serialis]
MDGDTEAYILLLLSDSNLPTGSFVASAGLESYITHGFFSSLTQSLHPRDKTDATMDFLHDSLKSYARSALPFVSDAHTVIQRLLADSQDPSEQSLDTGLKAIMALDELYESMTLNHVARRASKSQGVALLTLYSKGFSRPSTRRQRHVQAAMPHSADSETCWEAQAGVFVERLKLLIRQEKTHGHLPICWGVLTACLGLSLERSQYLHLFLHARSLLSASVRLNTIGPYAAQQLLLHAVKPLVEAEAMKNRDIRTGIDLDSDAGLGGQTTHGPAVTWPLGEILAARHDLQHSRIFNS